MPIQYCFESSADLALFKRLLPEKAENAVSFDEWIANNSTNPLLKVEERLTLASTFTKTSLKPEEWLPTIELLRKSLILNSEQVTHCLTSLPNTKKNRLLRECFDFYLNTPLANDWMSRIWEILGKLKSNSFTLATPVDLICVPAQPSSYLFQEFCEATKHLPAPSSSSTVSFKDLGETSDTSSPTISWGSRLQALNGLANQVSLFCKNHQETVLLSFFGKPQSRTFLRLRLAADGLTVSDFFEDRSHGLTFWPELLKNLRTSITIPLKQRLLLSSKLIQNPTYYQEKSELYFERLKSRGILSLEEEKFLKSLEVSSSKEKLEPKGARILIVPFQELPEVEGFKQFSFCDETLTEPVFETVLLSEPELEALFFSGFHVPRWSEKEKSRLSTLLGKAQSPSQSLFASIALENLEGYSIEAIKSAQPSSPTRNKNYQASLPVKTLSATQLETFAECPSKYFFRRLKLSKIPSAMNDFALLYGQAVHLTLEHLFAQAHRPILNEELLNSQFSQSLPQVLPHSAKNSAISIIFKKAFQKTIPKIIDSENQLRFLFGTTRTLAVEKEFRIEVEGIAVVGKIDRIDLLDNNHLLVLDYKTGTVDFTPDHIAQGSNFQALLYWLGAQQEFNLPLAAMLFYDLKKGEIKRGLASESAISPEAKKGLTRGHTLKTEKLDPLLETGKQALKQLAFSIRQGLFSPTPSAESCRFCEASSFCREGVGYV